MKLVISTSGSLFCFTARIEHSFPQPFLDPSTMASHTAYTSPVRPFDLQGPDGPWADCKVGVPGEDDRAARPNERICKFREIQTDGFTQSMHSSIKCLVDGLGTTRLSLGSQGRELKYEVGGLMKRHTDRMSRSGDLVKFATVVVLHPGEYKGGHLVLYDGQREIVRHTADPKNYTIVMFWSNMFHEVTEVTEGTRFATVFPVFRDESLELTDRTVQLKPMEIEMSPYSKWQPLYNGEVMYTGDTINDQLKISPSRQYHNGYWYKGCAKTITRHCGLLIVLMKGTVRAGDQEWTSDGETRLLINGFSRRDEIHVAGDFYTYDMAPRYKVSQSTEPTPSAKQLVLDKIKKIIEDLKNGDGYRGFARIAELQKMADAEGEKECEYCALLDGLEKNPLTHPIPTGYERPQSCTCVEEDEEEEDEEEVNEDEDEDLMPLMLPLGSTSGVYHMRNLYSEVPKDDGSDLIGQDRKVYDQVQTLGYRVTFEIRTNNEERKTHRVTHCVNEFGRATFNDEIELEFDDGSDFQGTIYQRQWVMVYQ